METIAQPKTIRDLADEKIALFRNIDALDVNIIARELVELSSLWASCNKELIDRKMWYAEQRKRMLEAHGSAAKAEIYAQSSPEYRDLLEAESYAKSILEMIRVGKRYLRLMETEQKEGIY